MAAVLEAGADIVVRAKWNGARWLDADGGKFDLIKLLKKAREDCLDQPIWIGRPSILPPLRLAPQTRPACSPSLSACLPARALFGGGGNLLRLCAARFAGAAAFPIISLFPPESAIQLRQEYTNPFSV